MKATSDNTQFGIIMLAVLLFIVTGIVIFTTEMWKAAEKRGKPHLCRWSECPYKGVAFAGRDSAVTHYVGDSLRMSDSWCIDMLHIEYPTLEYDSLETLMWKSK